MKKYLVVFFTAMIFASLGLAHAMAADVYSVIAQKPYILVDGETGQTYNQLSGTCTMNWKGKTRYGFFNAKIDVVNSPVRLSYEFQLVAISNCSNSEIEGIWDIKRNGSLVASGIVGKLYGLDQPVGAYFKFYGGDSLCYAEKWHLSAFITERIDY